MTRLIPLLLLVAGCAATHEPRPADAFFDRLTGLCGRAYEGRVVEDTPTPSPDFAGKRVVMHVAACSADEVRIPVQVGEDRSRTWIVRRTAAGLQLKHDHRHADGTPDRRTNYGGDAIAGTTSRQSFPADAESKALFVADGIPQSAANVWSLEVEPGRVFAYELARPARRFRLQFDLTRPVPPPGS